MRLAVAKPVAWTVSIAAIAQSGPFSHSRRSLSTTVHFNGTLRTQKRNLLQRCASMNSGGQPICVRIGPSVLSADLSDLKSECRKLIDAGADYLHLDVMDGHFVPNLTIGAPVISSLRRHFPKSITFDVHMMVADPEYWVRDIAAAGGTVYTFHLESCKDAQKIINMIRETGMKVGVAIKPGTEYASVYGLLKYVDMLLVMTVEPGFGGQTIIPEMLNKVRQARSDFPFLDIEVDGGVTAHNIDMCVEAGANCIVSGSGIVKEQNPEAMINLMRERGNKILMTKYMTPFSL